MNPTHSAARAYRQVGLQDADPVRLTAAATRGAAVEVERAQTALDANRIGEFCEAVTRASSLIGALREGLDLAGGGELARNLDRIYVYIQLRLVRAGSSRDRGLLEEVGGHLSGLASAWESI
ncbi:MAG: flagellar export chaperone FliS [Acidobacteriota bacterium]